GRPTAVVGERRRREQRREQERERAGHLSHRRHVALVPYGEAKLRRRRAGRSTSARRTRHPRHACKAALSPRSLPSPMTPANLFIAALAFIILFGVLAGLFFKVTRVPDILLVMAAGIVLG